MVWLSSIHILPFTVFGLAALYDTLRAKPLTALLIPLPPFLAAFFATAGFLYFRRPGPLAWAAVAVLLLTTPLLVLDARRDIRHLRATDPAFTGPAAALTLLTVLAVFGPPYLFALSWALPD